MGEPLVMTPSERERLMFAVETLARFVLSGLPGTAGVRYDSPGDRTFMKVADSWLSGAEREELPPLEQGQQLALAVLFGDAIPEALADFMLDSGQSYAAECYERGRRAGLAECQKIMTGPRIIHVEELPAAAVASFTRLPDTPTEEGR